MSTEIHFGPWILDPGQVFYETHSTYGIVNLKPIVPGHVLIIPKRVCPRIVDLTSEEVSDLFATVHKVAPVIERHYQGDSLNIAIQDGASAGQTVPHVHVHILPRRVSHTSSLCQITFPLNRLGTLREAMKYMRDWIAMMPQSTSPRLACREAERRWLQRAQSFANYSRAKVGLS
jgi:diadenosine tetraphosphate (Ap4A) HIT family hydrolase